MRGLLDKILVQKVAGISFVIDLNQHAGIGIETSHRNRVVPRSKRVCKLNPLVAAAGDDE